MPSNSDFKSFYSDATGGEGERCHYPTRLDTYGCGCAHDCAYCYAKSLLDFRGNWHPDNPSIASTEDISKALKKVKRGQILRLGGMTDCFQPLERVYGATRQAIQMLNARGIGYLIVTKSALVAEKAYTRIMDPELAHIQISVTSTTDGPNVLRERASKPSDRLSDDERKAYALVHNKLTMNTGFDLPILSGELDAITDIDMGEYGFSLDIGAMDIDGLLDEEPQIKKEDKPRVVTVVCECCGESFDVEL